MPRHQLHLTADSHPISTTKMEACSSEITSYVMSSTSCSCQGSSIFTLLYTTSHLTRQRVQIRAEEMVTVYNKLLTVDLLELFQITTEAQIFVNMAQHLNVRGNGSSKVKRCRVDE